jgi:hypothetical protein
MGKSYKKHPFTGFTTAKSEKDDKRLVNRNVRHKVNVMLKHIDLNKIDEDEVDLTLDKEDISDVWDFAKDGKMRVTPSDPFYKKAMRK